LAGENAQDEKERDICKVLPNRVAEKKVDEGGQTRLVRSEGGRRKNGVGKGRCTWVGGGGYSRIPMQRRCVQGYTGGKQGGVRPAVAKNYLDQDVCLWVKNTRKRKGEERVRIAENTYLSEGTYSTKKRTLKTS